MRSRLAATVLLSIGVFIAVTLFVSLGVLWWSGDATRGVRIGVICGAVAVLAVGAVSRYGRWVNDPVTNTSDLGMDGIAEQGLGSPQKRDVPLYSPNLAEGFFSEVQIQDLV
jgi:Na+/proline symporter